ncbi:hypothetical protein [Ruminococcus flavefaciens]|uniref:hypothetical protein n=1 Tax=Ruminococcus flavefaciens TaxID=1265 RepID=UPI0026EF5472|nr:hypothetical protein [Ruminococcus flavefaciens]
MDNNYGNNQYNNGYNNNGYNNGYNNNGYGGGYQNNAPYNNYNGNYNMPRDNRKGGGFAIASFVMALVNIVPCCTCLSIITVPLCIIFAVISLIQKRKGTAFAIVGIVLSVLAGIFFAYYGFIMYKIMPDAMYFAEHQQQITEDYDRDGTIPERFEKYRDPKYDKYWNNSGYDSFDEFFGKEIIEKNRYRLGSSSSSRSSSRSSSSRKSSGGSIDDLTLTFSPVFA